MRFPGASQETARGLVLPSGFSFAWDYWGVVLGAGSGAGWRPFSRGGLLPRRVLRAAWCEGAAFLVRNLAE